jgi:hypothetical protein
MEMRFQFDTLQTVEVDENVSDVAVGDLNNDGWNDLVIGHVDSSPEVEVFLNNGQGRMNTSPEYAFEAPCCYANVLVAIADVGGAGTDSTRNDGWNDIIVGGYSGEFGILINTGSSPYFGSSFEQEQSGGAYGYEWLKQIKVADVQNTGGQSVILSIAGGGYYSNEWATGRIHLFKHAGNPAPAPPKGVTGAGCPSTHPTITWAANNERDIEGYSVFKYIGDNQWSQLNEELITENTYTDYNEDVTCTDEEIPGPQSYRHYRVTAEDNAENESSPSASVSILVNGAAIEKRGALGFAPKAFALNAAYPNPFNPSTQIEFDLPEDAFVLLNVFDVLGRKVGELANGNYTAGYHTATWNASNSLGLALSGGVYFARLTVTDNHGKVKFSKVNKLILMK